MEEAYLQTPPTIEIKEPPALLYKEEEMVRVMSFNIRWDDQAEKPEFCWKQRKNQVASMIRFHRVDLAGLQEPLKNQMDDLSRMLPDHSWVGFGLDDGEEKGPMDAIVYRKSRYAVLDQGCFFLSATPDIPSKGWDAKFPRGVTWVKFFDKRTEKHFFLFNTHFDYHGKWSREESAYLLQEKIAEIVQQEPFIVTGDFNLFPELGGNETYRILTRSGKKMLRDAQHSAIFPHHGPTGSWSGFKEAGQPGIKPDYIFVCRNCSVVSHGILADCFDGKFPSDHLPVVADIILQ